MNNHQNNNKRLHIWRLYIVEDTITLFSTYGFPGNLVFNTASIQSITSDSCLGSRFCESKHRQCIIKS